MKNKLILFIALLFSATSMWAITPIYVNGGTGDDLWDGSSATWVSGTIGPKATIQGGISAVSSGGTVNVAAWTYTEVGQIVVNKNLSIIGAGKLTTIIKPSGNTGNSGDAKAWWLVNAGIIFNLNEVTLDGTGKMIFHGIRHKGTGTIQNVHFTGITYNASGPDYAGFAIYAFGMCGAVNVSNCQFDNIGREGIAYWGAGTTGTYADNTYTGKGLGNWLDYAVEVTTGAVVTITGSTITNCRGTATLDGSNSAGIIVLLDNSTATITGNTINGNDIAIKVGYNSPVSSATAYAHGNAIFNNTSGTLHGTAGGVFDATNNWWGAASGPYHATLNPSGTGNAISDNVAFNPWYNTAAMTTKTYLVGAGETYTTIQAAINAASSGDIINVAAGTYTEQVTITKSLDLIGAGELSTTILAPVTRTGSVSNDYSSPTVVHDYLLAAYATSGTIDVRVEGFTLDVNGQNMTSGTGQMDGVFFRDVTDAGGTVAGLFSCTVHDFAATPDYEGFGVVVYGTSLLTVNDNDIHDYTRDGISINRYGTGTATNVTISGNTVTGSGTSLNSINIDNVTAGAVTGNTITGNTRSAPSAGCGIAIWTSTGVPVNGNHVNGNYNGMDLLDGTHNITISGNDLTDNIKRGISLGSISATNDNTVKGNTITGPVVGTDDVGIGIANGSTGNMIGGPTPADGNTITGAMTGSGMRRGIWLECSVGPNTIQYNNITVGGYAGIVVDGIGPGCYAAGQKINNNYVHDCLAGGFAINAQTAEFNYNRCLNNGFGIEMGAPGAIFVLRNNRIAGNDPSNTACALYGVCSSGLSVYDGSADAANNWWGSSTGPYHATLNTSGTGNSVSNNVTFIPWWCEVQMTSACPPLSPGMAIMNTNTGVQYTAAQLTLALTEALNGQTLYVAEGTVTGTTYNIPGKTVYIIGTGVPGQSVLSGGSPALTVSGGVLDVDWITFFNSTDFPTILVNGTGSLKIRDCIIHEAAGFNQSCLQVTGGTVDAGVSALDKGNNFFIVHGAGSAVDNGPAVALPAEYNDWGSANGPTIASNPGGDGGAIIGAGAANVDYAPWGGNPKTTVSAITVCSGAATVDIPITVTRFNNVGSFSLRFAYNASKLNTPTLVPGSLPAGIFAWGNWVMGTGTAGKIIVSDWGNLPTDGVSLTDGSTLFTLRFNIGTIAAADSALLRFVENTQGTALEFTGVAPDYPPYGDMPTATNYFNGGVSVVADPTLSQPENRTICKGGSTTLTTSPSGGTGTYSYQWQYSADGSTGWGDVVNGTPSGITYSGGTTTSLTITGDGSETSANKYYKCVLTTLTPVFGGCNTETLPITVTTVNDPVAPGLTKVPATADVCSGATLTVTISAGSGGVDTRTDEYRYNDGSGYTAWSTSVPSFPAVTGTNYIQSRSRNSGSGCESTVNEVSWIVNERKTISGTFTYYNLANTLLTGIVSVELVRVAGPVVFPVTTDPNPQTITGSGGYSFAHVCPSTAYTYELRASSTKSTEGSVNTTDAAQVNFWGVAPYNIEKVRFYTGDVFSPLNNFLNGSDAQAIQLYFVNASTTWPARPTWTFWRTGQTISANGSASPSVLYPTVDVPVGSNVTANMYGLCTGDFNRSFDPDLTKSASSSLQLVYSDTRQVSRNQEFELPVYTVNAAKVGAVSLILNFPADMVEVKDVVMNGAGGQLDWAPNGNELRIGWNSQNPLVLSAGTELITLRLRTTEAFTKGNSIRLKLASSPLNELADDHINVIGDAVLSVDVIDAALVGIGEQTAANGLTLNNHPNPFNSFTVFNYSLPFEGNVTLEIHDFLGKTVKVLVNELQTNGDHSIRYDAGTLAPGVYTATIRLSSNNDVRIRTIKLVNNR